MEHAEQTWVIKDKEGRFVRSYFDDGVEWTDRLSLARRYENEADAFVETNGIDESVGARPETLLTTDLLGDALVVLRWASGAPSFGPGGEAHEGWKRVAAPVIARIQTRLGETPSVPPSEPTQPSEPPPLAPSSSPAIRPALYCRPCASALRDFLLKAADDALAVDTLSPSGRAAVEAWRDATAAEKKKEER